MRTIALVTLISGLCLTAAGQDLIEIYKSGQVILDEDKSYGAANEWTDVFYDINYGVERHSDGKNKAIVLAPDGTVFMSHRSRHSISIFDKDGNYVRDFGRKGGHESDFVYMPFAGGVLSGKYLCTYSVDGRMLFFDLEGNWVKTHALDYMPMETAMLGDGKLAILGSSIWATKSRTFISIMDFDTGREKIIWDHFTDRLDTAPGQGAPGQKARKTEKTVEQLVFRRPRIMNDKDGNLVMVLPGNGEVKVFSPAGKVIRSYKLETGELMRITDEDRQEYYEKGMEALKKTEKAMQEEKDAKLKERSRRFIEQKKEYLEDYLDPELNPGYLPALSQAMIDSDNNLLGFRFTSEEGENKFYVYTFDKMGQKICESSFLSEEYDLDFSSTRFIFHSGDVVAIQFLKDEDSPVPLRLVRFTLKQE